jgi:excisionase family DNA binding protein
MNKKQARMLTVTEVAGLLHVHPNTVRLWCDRGMMPSYRIGTRGDRRFRSEDIDNFLSTWQKEKIGEIAVLIVDDDDAVRTILYEAITGKGYKAIAVENGERALEELKKHEFNLIFLDLMLPGLSGVEVLRHVKASEMEPVVTVITGYGDTPISIDAMNLSPTFFIRKPFEMNDILNILDLTMRLTR